MIVGIGNDIVNIKRIENILNKYPDKFTQRILSEYEYKVYQNKFIDNLDNVKKASYLSKRFAAKEALSKALGTGFTNGLNMNDIEIFSQINGKPSINPLNKAKKIITNLFGDKHNIFVTMSDDYPIAIATVVIDV